MDISPILHAILFIAAFCKGHDSTCNNYGYVKGFGKLIWNKRLRATYLQFYPTSLKQCAIECLVRRGRCKSINFSRQMSFCELNYRNLSDNQTAEKCTSFDYSDISTWSKDLIGKCKHKVCNEKERCSTKTGNCSLSDCGPVNFDIPKNSVIQNHGHHEIGNAVDFLCKKGYRMYNKTTLESMYVAIVKCKASGDWEKVEFVCLACDRKTLQVEKLVELVESTSSLVNEEYTLQCESGYRPYINGTTKSDSVTVTCNIQTHKWERPDFLCKKCDPISFEIPMDSVLQNNSHLDVDEESLNFTCADGYLMYNTNALESMPYKVMECNASGQWGNAEFVCLKCDPTFEIPKNSVLQNYNHLDVDEESLNFTCEDGYLMYNKDTLEPMQYRVMKCNASGQWGNTEFVCLRPCPSHCQGISLTQLAANDVHRICPFGNSTSLEVMCKVIEKRIWTIIQTRFDGKEDFYRTWKDYKHGFGNATGEYWIGNDVLHALTSTRNCQLMVVLENWRPATAYASYMHFAIGDESTAYRLYVEGYKGNAGDSMWQNNGRIFSTKDRNKYLVKTKERCSDRHKSGWWHWKYDKWCSYANLNGLYRNMTIGYSTMYWYTWFNNFAPVKSCAMMITC